MFYGKLFNGKFSPGPESSDVKLFSKEEIPWDNLAFPVIKKTITLYYEDKKNGTIDIHFETIKKK